MLGLQPAYLPNYRAERDYEVMQHAGPNTQIIDLKGRRMPPDSIDSHLHIIGGRLEF
jgi:predicted amidohydrolase YtcJ